MIPSSTSCSSSPLALAAPAASESRLSAPLQGFVDYSQTEQYAFAIWQKTVVAVYERFGFSPLHLRPLERLAALKGETENQKQMFGVYRTDGQIDTGLALPFDHTVPLALYIAEQAGYRKNCKLPYKRYDVGLSFRGERPQVGRFRAFVQADIDIVGPSLGLSADAECLCALIQALQELPIGEFRVSINHIDIVKGILSLVEIPEEFHAAILRSIDKLDKKSPEEVKEEILQIPDLPLTEAKVLELLHYFTREDLSSLSDSLFSTANPQALKGWQDLQTLLELLSIMGVDRSFFHIDLRMVRGLDYYTGMVFETFLQDKPQYGSIASGGRYSNLVGKFADNLSQVEGVGGSIGLTRLFELEGNKSLSQRITMADVLVGYRTVEQQQLAFSIATYLREHHYRVDVYSGKPNVKKIVTHADHLGVPFIVIVMDTSAIAVKNMYTPRETKQEPDVSSPEEVLEKLRSFSSIA